jgi:hypothetical protein
MQQFTFAFLMSALSSQRVKNAVASATFFGAAGALRGACARLESFTRTIHKIEDKYPERAEKMRTSTTYQDLDKKAEQAANRAAAIHAIAEEHGVMIRLEFEPPMPKSKTNEELEQLAALTRMAKDDIAKHVDSANQKRYAAEVEASDLASSLFWTACADSDAPIKFESVAKAIERTRLQMLTWSSIDFAELALIASDELALDDWMSSMSDDPRQFQEDDDVIEERHRKAEVAALDAHARQRETVAYLDEERAKASKRRRTRVPKQAA